jgi:hypothetical protein
MGKVQWRACCGRLGCTWKWNVQFVGSAPRPRFFRTMLAAGRTHMSLRPESCGKRQDPSWYSRPLPHAANCPSSRSRSHALCLVPSRALARSRSLALSRSLFAPLLALVRALSVSHSPSRALDHSRSLALAPRAPARALSQPSARALTAHSALRPTHHTRQSWWSSPTPARHAVVSARSSYGCYGWGAAGYFTVLSRATRQRRVRSVRHERPQHQAQLLHHNDLRAGTDLAAPKNAARANGLRARHLSHERAQPRVSGAAAMGKPRVLPAGHVRALCAPALFVAARWCGASGVCSACRQPTPSAGEQR